MTVADLIRELGKLPPHNIVRAHNSEFVFLNDGGGDTTTYLDETDAQEVTEIKWRGSDVVLVAGGMCRG